MKTITLRELSRNPEFGRLAHAGQSFLVTHRGRPYFRILPPSGPPSDVGAGSHLAKGPALSPEPIRSFAIPGRAGLSTIRSSLRGCVRDFTLRFRAWPVAPACG